MADVLGRKFAFSAEEIKQRGALSARWRARSVRLDIIKEDPSDNRLLECAMSAGSDYIVTEDKDRLRLGRHDSISTTTVAKFMETANVLER